LACLKLTDHFGALLSGHAPIHALDFNLSVVFRHVWGIEMGVHLHLLTLLHTHTHAYPPAFASCKWNQMDSFIAN